MSVEGTVKGWCLLFERLRLIFLTDSLCLPASAALQAASKWSEAAASFERAAWLAASVERDHAAAAEYEAAGQQAKASTRVGRTGSRDGF